MLKKYVLTAVMLLPGIFLHAQTVTGVVKDEKGELLYGTTVVIKGTTNAAVSDFEGEFTLNAKQEPPFTLVVSYIGYEPTELEITADNIRQKVTIVLKGTEVILEGAEVRDVRITEKEKESPLTIESLNLAAIKQTPAADFYTGLGNLKGVDLTTASLGFVVINTRGFNSTRPVRSLQLVDGADNQAPGLNFSLGNFAGSSEIDILKVDLIVGASSTLYGPNAFNGVINMNTKSPFIHKGLSVFLKGAERSLFETGVRYARAFTDKAGDDRFAFKINFAYVRADDWEATNMDPTPQSVQGVGNPGGYDAVNRYGDENQSEQSNNFSSKYGTRNNPGLGTFYRTGYEEKYLVDYDMRNIKTGASLHYRVGRSKDIELVAAHSFGTGTTVYQGENRYSLKNLRFNQVRLEVMKPDKFYVRAYTTMENGGDTYDAVFTAFKLQEYSKQNISWSTDYTFAWISRYQQKVTELPGFPDVNSPLWADTSLTEDGSMTISDSIYNQALAVMDFYNDSLTAWHAATRAFADTANTRNNPPRLEPGTAEYDSVFNEITSRTSFTEGGTKFYDKSKLVHVQGEYKFTPKFMDIIVGGNFREYFPNSDGTIFSDTSGRKIRNWEFGVYTGLEKKLWLNRLILTVAARLDKNQNFDVLVSPAASIVYRQKDQTLRFSLSSALRNPTLQDQYLYYNVGRAILIGNIDGTTGLVTLESLTDYLEDFSNPDRLRYIDIPPVRPERVLSVEAGYRGILSKQVYIDASFYHSWYTDFLGYRLMITDPTSGQGGQPERLQAYRVSANSPDRVVTYGFSAGVTYYFLKNYTLSGNYSWNVLDRRGSEDPIIPAFNTPEHKFNVGIGGSNITVRLGKTKITGLGFNFNYKWIQGFKFEGSPQFTGSVPTYSLLDGQINYTNKKIYTTFKLGASNLLNKLQYQTYGGPYVGRMVYFSVLFEMPEW